MCPRATTSCPHLKDFKSSDLETFKILHELFVVCADNEAKITKLKNAFCHICKCLGPHLHACSHCVFFGCYKHIRDHTRVKKHHFSIELSYGQLHCAKCGDYVYDTELDKIAIRNLMSAKKCNKRLLNWVGSQELDLDSIQMKSKRVRITPESTIGLRGLVNLGNTCYMNCIIQTLMHTPLLRDYFLSERHKCKGVADSCIPCELSRVFQEFYKGECAPLALDKLLHMVRKEARYLKGGEQQDVHEFFGILLEKLHLHFVNAMPSIHSISTDKVSKCPCIIHQLFTGEQNSTVVCQLCKGVSTVLEPLSEILLDLGQLPPITVGQQASIIDCLKGYMHTEILEKTVFCSNCQSKQTSTKQLTFKTLPHILNFQLKRYATYDKTSKKVSTKIKIPEMLDMTPFVSRTKESRLTVFPTDNLYSLFAVINHIGDINGGHYKVFVRQKSDYWYLCNDYDIQQAHIKEVLESEWYVLFYHKHIICYE